MGIISHILNQDAQVITTIKDKHGDQVIDSSIDTLCRFRYITDLDKGPNREGVTSSEAIIWFEPTENIVEGNIVKVDDKYWRVSKLIKARRMSGSNVEFLKAFVNKHEPVE